MFAFLAPAALKLLLGRMWTNAKADYARIPPKVKLVLLALALAFAAFLLHQHVAHKALKAADQAGYNRRASEDAAALVELQRRVRTAEANGTAIATDTRSKNDASNSAINAHADALSMRGPGAARCRQVSNPVVPAASSEHGAGSDRPADAAGGSVPAGDGQSNLAAVPFDWLVNRARQCDLDRAENLSWRDWYVRESAEWQKLTSERGGQ
jgi:hypothetical protein